VVGIEEPVASRYAHLVEMGAAHMPAEPFMRPALDEKAHEALQIQRQALLDGIDREVRKLATLP
jgi:HK97 gp10 family phage protein